MSFIPTRRQTSESITRSPRSPSTASSSKVATAPTIHQQARSVSLSPVPDFDGPSSPPKRMRTETADGMTASASTSRPSPLAKRLGEEPPFMLPHPSIENPASSLYPGVVLGSFAGGDGTTGLGFGSDELKFDGDMDDILDPSATRTVRQGSGSGTVHGQAAPNIAPWLMDDTPEREEEPARSRDLNHFSSVPSLSKMRRETTPEGSRNGSGSALGLQTSGNGGGAETTRSSRINSQDSQDTVAAKPVEVEKATPPKVLPGGGRGKRVGSTISIASISSNVGSEKKKGFLGGLLKRKTGQSVSLCECRERPESSTADADADADTAAPTDFGPVDYGHGSRAGSGSSRLSHASSYGSLGKKSSISQDRSASDSMPRHRGNYEPEALISPLEESGEPEWKLDMDLDNMEGIVDPTLANATPEPPSTSGSTVSESLASSSMGFADALNQTSSLATTPSNDSTDSSGTNGSPAPGRTLIGEAQRDRQTFNRPNPFMTGSSAGSIELNKPGTPPSPHSLSPKHSLPSYSTQPRRPSQLRNVKMGSTDSETSADNSSLQPIAPTWAGLLAPSQSTVFNTDPFGTTKSATDSRPNSRSARTTPVQPADSKMGTPPGLDLKLTAPTIAGGAAWAAPESWGVEGDEEEPEETTSEEEDADWVEAEPSDNLSRSSSLAPVTNGKKPPPFGTRPPSSNGPRTARGSGTRPPTASGKAKGLKPSNARMSTSTRPGTGNGRPGTSGSHASVLPLAIQTRRVQQAGYEDIDGLEELGKLDWLILCKFIYQTPLLPIMDPEGSYDSFEFIDLAGRDLQVIPIFLHLHAHNIIILNVSRNPMADLPLDFIQACTSLKELRMSNMALKRVPASIKQSTTLARLDVSCNRIADLESVQLNDISTLTSLYVQNNKLVSIPSYFAQMKSLKYLNISNNKFETFPSVVCEMSNLVDLDVSFNEIAELPSEMSNLKSLERLACVGNELERFPESFSTLANLRILDVRRNKLTDLTSVYALPNLAELKADSNNLVTLDAILGAKVREFRAPYNSITRFTLAPLPDLSTAYALTHLNLSHGKISTLAEDALKELVNLTSLNLNFNQFTQLPDALTTLTKLEYFSCTDNGLTTLPDGLRHLNRLQIINVHNNNIKSIPAALWLCGSVREVNLSSNLMSAAPDPPLEYIESFMAEQARKRAQGEVAADVFSLPIAKSLEYISLADNSFKDEIFHQISHLPNLKVLNLSFNEIYEIPPDTLRKNFKMEQLYLSGNKLTTLPAEDLERLCNLRVLHLNGNKLQTLPSELGAIKTLQHLDVGSNVLKYNIANWPYDWNCGQDMSHPSSLRKELSDFSALTHLRILGLMDVTLRIPSLPDENEEKRVRTSFSDVNNMAYGISDVLGGIEHLAMFDLVVPNFRGQENECIFGMFGRAAPSGPAGKIPKILQEIFAATLAAAIADLDPEEAMDEALRRTFLSCNRQVCEYMEELDQRRKSSAASLDVKGGNSFLGAGSQMRTGSSGAVVYMRDKTMHVANVGDILVVLSRKGEAELLGKRHDPTDREETARIRRAEAWVTTKGHVNDDKEIDISRAFGFYHAFPAVNACPETLTRTLEESDEFVIIGNHALWKCSSYQTAVDIARTERDDPMMAAQKLRDFAIAYGAEGSVMVMVVNISDLFGNGQRRALGSMAPTDAADADAIYKRFARRKDEVGDRTLNRLQQEVEPPTGQVALVFTDIKNSTALWETNPGMATAIKMHHNLMRRQLRLDGGYEVKTEGDSFMVSFPTVTAGLLWCFNCQIGLLQLEWPRELLACEDGKEVFDKEGNIIQRGLSVRMGIHWGTPSCERDPITRRMDYYGPMVNRSARINASADGGQLMASLDVINEIKAINQFVDDREDADTTEIPPEMKREVTELKRIGVEIKEMGERKLKGLEVPEKLHLIYPRSLKGRLELSDTLRANVEVEKTFLAERLIDIDEVRQLAMLCLRLEALSALQPKSSTSALKVLPPVHLGPVIKQEMTDEELCVIIDSLTTRMENAMSTLYIKNLGGFASVLAALEKATRIDQNLLVHAMSLMSGAMSLE
ncbi:hypothetical protein P7C73_g5383, partial [Tremellales sp. Uapishka_1]